MLIPFISPIDFGTDDISASFKLSFNDVYLSLLVSSQKLGSNKLECVIAIFFKKDDPTIRICI
jgi:hypothetical protein